MEGDACLNSNQNSSLGVFTSNINNILVDKISCIDP